ncbi:MAG TPA: hypothetical protein VGY54_20715 [Polyangiaceae bacterium]|jgi:DNA-binding NarL/FixJ family response regulator|nr:hypothetical protein [Polyangiaceae bacterium]
MSSVSQIAVAQDYSASLDAPARALLSTSPLNERRSDALSRAASDAVQASVLASLWEDLVRGRLRVWCESTTADRIYLVARLKRRHPSLSPDDSAVLVRILCGEQLKVVAAELGIATSTAYGRRQRALHQLDLAHRAMPLSLVLAAQRCAGVALGVSARSAVFEHRGVLALMVSVPKPVTARMTALTRAEQEVAQRLIEGDCRDEIALRRTTSAHTVTRQLSSISKTLQISGRCGLIRYAVERGCFQ